VIEQLLQADRLLVVDQVEQARELYARVAALDPRNAIAVVGLARCALADGDDQAAYELAAKALRIDPENDMAARMEARLAEILAERGKPVARAEPGAAPDPRAQPDAAADPARSAAAPSLTPAPAAPAQRSLLDRLLGR
jgi:tetratricopeptide (TPR) repeat protein